MFHLPAVDLLFPVIVRVLAGRLEVLEHRLEVGQAQLPRRTGQHAVELFHRVVVRAAAIFGSVSCVIVPIRVPIRVKGDFR